MEDKKDQVLKIYYDMIIYDIKAKMCMMNGINENEHTCMYQDSFHVDNKGSEILHICNMCNQKVCKKCNNYFSNTIKNEHYQCRRIIDNIVDRLQNL